MNFSIVTYIISILFTIAIIIHGFIFGFNENTITAISFNVFMMVIMSIVDAVMKNIFTTDKNQDAINEIWKELGNKSATMVELADQNKKLFDSYDQVFKAAEEAKKALQHFNLGHSLSGRK